MKQQHLPFFQSPTGDRPFLAMGLLRFGVFTLALQDATVKLIAPETTLKARHDVAGWLPYGSRRHNDALAQLT